jgi:lipid-A-disaccharide synthase
MVNLMAGERVVPELIQGELKAERLLEESRRILDRPDIRADMVEKLAKLKENLGSPGAAGRVADMAIAMMA